MVCGQLLGVVPDVHAWVVEDVLQRTVIPAEVRMVEMTYSYGKNVHDEVVFDAEANHRERDILNRFVDNRFHPMET